MSEVKTEKVTKIQDLTEELVSCDNNHAFAASQVKLVPFNINAGKDLGDMLIVDQDFNIKSNMGDSVTSGFLMACPVCNVLQLSGFNNPNSKSTLVEGNDNTIAVRNLAPEL